MRSRKNPHEKIIFLVPERIKDTLRRSSGGFLCLKNIEEINNSIDAIQQINFLKNIQKILMEKKPDELSADQIWIEILCIMFYQCPLKNSHKKTLNRILLDLSYHNAEVVQHSLCCSLENFLNESIENCSISAIESCIDCLTGLLDNFPTGITAIEAKYDRVLKFLSASLNFILQDINKSNSPDLYAICQSLLKTLILAFQHISEDFKSSLNKNEKLCVWSESINNGIKSLLMCDLATLNCRLNAGIALCHVYSIFCSPNFQDSMFSNEGCSVLEVEKFPVSSQLCIYSGIMAVLPIQEFVAVLDNDSLANKLIKKILHISKRVEESDLLLLCGRAILQWSNLMRDALFYGKKNNIEDFEISHIKKMFQEYDNIIGSLFQYVLAYREHFVDSLRHLSKDLLKNILNLHMLSIEFGQDSPLLKKMTLYLVVDLPLYSQGKYGLLSCIVDIIGTDILLQWYPLLPEYLYDALQEVHMVSHVSELLECLYRKSKQTEDHNEFVDIWLKPLLKHLCSKSKEQSMAVNDHVLPKLFKAQPNCLEFLLSSLISIWESNKGNCFSALITCIKLHQTKKNVESVFNLISFDSLAKAVCHRDDEVRLSALSLLCENSKSTATVPKEVFQLLEISLPYNVNCQSPAFRQQLVTYLKKLFKRMSESKYSLEKKKASGSCMSSQFSNITSKYDNFLYRLKKFLYGCLYPGANFPRRVTALNLLSLLNSIFPNSFCCVSELPEAETLLYTLQDTYENNKLISLKILSSSNLCLLQLENKNFPETLLQTALILASSTKPPDAVTAAYLFALMVQHRSFDSSLLKYVKDQIDKGLHHSNFTEQLYHNSLRSSNFIAVLLLIGELQYHLKVAEKSLLDAAAKTPLYGILACIRSVLMQMDFKCLKDSESINKWQQLMQELIALCLKVAAVVEPVVCNSSPEGHLPMETTSDNIQQLQFAVRRAIGKRFQTAVVETDQTPSTSEREEVVLDLVKTHAVTAQILLLCCWRSHKEISLLFGEIAENLPVCDNEGNGDTGILTVKQALEIGEHFIQQMTLVKHKGAFEQAYIGFCKLCHMLWRCKVKELEESPKLWLTDLLLAIKGMKENIQLCSTRRSAGLPFIIQALLSAEPGLTNSKFFKETVTSLLSMASFKTEQNSLDEQIHALNILRALFRDACLSEVLMPFVSEGLRVSITGFKSPSWAVRNSSTLLFSALMTRIFGVKCSQNEAGKKNRLTGKTFFSYHKDVYSFLFKELKNCSSILLENQNSMSLVPALYPILLLLERLYPAPGDSDPRLSSLVPFLHAFASSPVWKVRVLAAKALVPLISVENVVSTLQSLFDSLASSEDSQLSHNSIHGKCLQIYRYLFVVQECTSYSKDHRKIIEDSLPSWINSYFALIFNNNKCYTTRAAFLEIVFASMTFNTLLDPYLAKKIINELLIEMKAETSIPDKEHYLYFAVMISLLFLVQLKQEEIETFLLQTDQNCVSFSNFIRECLLTPYESVRCTVLQFLLCLFQNGEKQVLEIDSLVNPVFFTSAFDSSVLAIIQNFQSLHVALCSDSIVCLFVVRMLEKEVNNSSIIGVIYQLLCLMPYTISLQWEFLSESSSSCACYKLGYVLLHLESCKRDEVSNPILLYSTHIVKRIVKDFPVNNQDDSFAKCEHCSSVFVKWSEMIEVSAQPENCISRRMTLILCLKLVFEPLSIKKLKLLGRDTIHLWQALLSLLMDDEPEVKHCSSEIIVSLQACNNPDERFLPVVPSLALDLMVELFIKEDMYCSSDYIGTLLNWLVSNTNHPTDVIDEQPFDKGELNVFSEDLLLTSIVSKHLKAFIRSQQKQHNKLLISLDKISCWKSTHFPNPERFNSEQALNLCIDECNSILENFLSRGAISSLLDTYFDQDLIQLCQRLHVILCLASELECHLKSQVIKLLEKIKSLKCRTCFLEDLVLQLRLLL